MKKKKRKLSGMTLVEVLVALAVFAIISALLASACAGVTSTIRKTNRLNKKISVEAPDAELKNGTPVTLPDGTIEETTLTLVVGDAEYTVDGEMHLTSDSENGYEEGGDFKYFKVGDGDDTVQEVP